MVVDLHVHLFPPRMFEAVWRYFEDRDWQVHRQQVDDVADTLRAHGIQMATGLSYPHKAGVATTLNTFMEGVGKDNDLFRPFASVHVEDADMRDQARHTIESPHLYGFKFQPLVQGFDLNDTRLDYLYDGCLEADFPVLIHAGDAPLATPFVGYSHFARLLERYPGLRVCVAHMGASEFDPFLRLMDDHPKMYFDTAMINTWTDLFHNEWRGDAERLARHADRVCFGSDWPNVPYPYEEALESVKRFPLPDEALAGVMGGNALDFLKIT